MKRQVKKIVVDDNTKEMRRWLKSLFEPPPPSPDKETLLAWLEKPGKRSKLEKAVTMRETALTVLQTALKEYP